MGKPAYLHRRKWQDKKLLNLVIYCRGLYGHTKGRTLQQLTFHHFGKDGLKLQGEMKKLLKEVYYYLMHNEGILFGPVTLGGWGSQYVWCVATQNWERKQIMRRWLRNANGNLKRIFGSAELRDNWLGALGEPLLPMLEKHEQIKEASHEFLMPLKVICPQCQAEVFGANFCPQCGGKLK